ncbi:MAG: hypothetical protein ACPG4T_24540, partial [Nannocystaceae bacterium]
RWVHWLTGQVIDGQDAGVTQTIAAPLGLVPVFLRDGGLVPLLRPTIDTLAGVDNPDEVDSFAVDPGVLHARAFVATKRAEFTVYDGTRLEAKPTDTGATISVSPGSTFTAGAQVELVSFGPPAEVSVEGQPLAQHPSAQALEDAPSGWFHDGTNLHVRVGSGAMTVQVTL